MNINIPRYPDSLILSKCEKIALTLSKNEWNVNAHSDHAELFSVTSKTGEKKPWDKNGVAKRVAEGTGVSCYTFNFTIDGRQVAQIQRLNDQPNDRLTVNHNWFGGSDENARASYVAATDAIGGEFVTSRFTARNQIGPTEELARFVEVRDQALVRLEELQSRLTKQIIEDRERANTELEEKENELAETYKALQTKLDESHAAKLASVEERENALAKKLKEVDDRESRFVRREIRNQLKTEIKNRQSKFELTTGTQKMRRPIMVAVGSLAVVLTIGFFYYTIELIAATTAKPPVEPYLLAILLVRQIFLGLGLAGAVWFFVRWQNQWSERHANEEFAVKRLELDLDRASWVVELAMEWKTEKQGQEIPPAILAELTKNLFNDRDHQPKSKPDIMSALLDASTRAEIAVGGSKVMLDRKGAKKLSEALDSGN